MSFTPDTSHNGPAPFTPVQAARERGDAADSTFGSLAERPRSPTQAPQQEGAAPSAPEASVAQPAEQHAASSSDAPPVQPEAAAAQVSPTRNPEVEALSLQVGELLTTVQTLTQATLQQPAVPASATPPRPTKAATATASVPTQSFPAQAAPLFVPTSPRPVSEASSESSSSSEGSSKPACRVCGSKQHLEVDCPWLSSNGGGGGGDKGSPPGSDPPLPPPAASPGRGAASSAPEETQTPADYEETVIRIKSLSDMTFPQPPTNAGQARGYVNQVLVAIARVQRTPGDEVYQWAQECLTHTQRLSLSRIRGFPASLAKCRRSC